MKLTISHTRNTITLEQDRTVLNIYPFNVAVGKISSSIIENAGDLLVGSAAGQIENLPKGDNDEVLTMVAGNLAWQNPIGGAASILDACERITGTTSVPVTTTDVTGISSVFVTPFMGDKVSLYSDSAWTRRTIEEIEVKLTNALTGTTTNGTKVITGLSSTVGLCSGMEVTGTGIGGSAIIDTIDSATQVTLDTNSTADGTVTITFKIPADTNFDIFLYDNDGTILHELLLWTDATTRATELTFQNGKYTKTGDTTRLYIGTVRTTSTAGETEDSEAKRFIWNLYNQRWRSLYILDTTSHTYTLATWRQWRATAANKVEWVVGLEEGIVIPGSHQTMGTNVSGYYGYGGIVLDAIGSASQELGYSLNGSTQTRAFSPTGKLLTGLLGYHVLYLVEYQTAGTYSTFSRGSILSKIRN